MFLSRPDDPDQKFYSDTLALLNKKKLPFLVGGAFALHHYTGISRDTKDLDLFCKASDLKQITGALEEIGCRTESTFPHWLAKAYSDGERFVDLIFSSGNGLCPVDDEWFMRAGKSEILGHSVPVMPSEEMIWQKAFIMERERYDGADVAHLIRATGKVMDWDHLISRFDEKWRVLLSHLILFGFTYPSDRGAVPSEVLYELLDRLAADEKGPGDDSKVCWGMVLSREQYLPDKKWGYDDPRLKPTGVMTQADVKRWTQPVFDREKENRNDLGEKP
jgi:hypothetical protein